ncbi:hypothetical protein HGA34_04560 [Candidatus Falkowbacteria bacterium]|nr:hypothetical protein [Candidatus Falkowbacteria bacterium]
MKGPYFVTNPGLMPPVAHIAAMPVPEKMFENWRSWSPGDGVCPACNGTHIGTEEVISGDLRGERLRCKDCNAVGGASVF